MLSKMTIGQLIVFMAILKMNTTRSSGETLSGIGVGRNGTEPQLSDVVLIVVWFMFSGLNQLSSLVRVASRIRSCSGQFDC